MVKEIERLLEGDAHARRLFTLIAPQCVLQDSPIGVMLQIDNCYAGERARAEAAEAEVVRLRAFVDKPCTCRIEMATFRVSGETCLHCGRRIE